MGKDANGHDGKVRCRGCNEDLAREDDDSVVVRVAEGKIEGVEDGLVDFTEVDSWDDGAWGYMHKKCFLLAVGDPEAITMMG